MQNKYLGINGLGRIGKLVLWNQMIEKHFNGYIISIGRRAGRSLQDLIDFILNDSTYGGLDRFMYGYSNKSLEVEILDEENYEIKIDGNYIKFLTTDRNPKDIKWGENHVNVVVDCTGVFLDPHADAEAKKGSARGHLAGGAKKVVVSAPFKIKGDDITLPEDTTMLVYGINHEKYDHNKHDVISAASCTTTALSHMMKPLLDHIDSSRILTASMSTIHAATNNQNLLDALPAQDAKDLRKTRSALNNIILTSTGAAKALEYILPEIKNIGFMADSVRIPTSTVSLVALNITFRSQLKASGEPVLNKAYINDLYKKAAQNGQKGYLVYSDKQNVSSDLRGFKASAVIEGVETATKTGFLPIPSQIINDMDAVGELQLPVTHAKIFGWYDNEFGSYVNSLSNILIHIDSEFSK
ncbi:MAG: glyceraldehyde-3-phosphate dehydrogenase [Clostridia bacterium]|nr:glyceraldehyde-3-phosphate dehydrogenase [Clostridia bacterium]